ncbi:phosphoglycerate mutase family protein [Paraburkholderia bryophila]|uniref:phosphoglycerate mutase family protein n=1 Tax=Paraburkholderia bryophila TaxID=420952 RepID=UPI002349F745|nr:phosphoglycerate mutase family protein [Paraburkholderia bryophila]WCM18699.1 phosphoglycerate mutase family protein [Paraburkholderia bryophila]
MYPTRIMFIRHAEKPEDGVSRGVTANGAMDNESLTPRGWQRAGALVRYFCPLSGDGVEGLLTPTVIFAAGVGPHSSSQRPVETVTPLVDFLKTSRPTPFVTSHLEDDGEALIVDVLSRDGVILVAWQHEQIPALIALIAQAPAVPQKWPDNRFDIVWILDRTLDGWRFSQMPQLLLSGDLSSPIS